MWAFTVTVTVSVTCRKPPDHDQFFICFLFLVIFVESFQFSFRFLRCQSSFPLVSAVCFWFCSDEVFCPFFDSSPQKGWCRREYRGNLCAPPPVCLPIFPSIGLSVCLSILTSIPLIQPLASPWGSPARKTGRWMDGLTDSPSILSDIAPNGVCC